MFKHEGLVDPSAWADYFARRLIGTDFHLDFELAGLGALVDKILNSGLFENYNLIVAEANRGQAGVLNKNKEHFKALAKYERLLEYETGLSAYLGECLSRAYNVPWSGTFAATGPIHNRYFSKLSLGGEDFYPSRYPASRLNGSHFEHGSFDQQLQILYDRIEAENLDSSSFRLVPARV